MAANYSIIADGIFDVRKIFQNFFDLAADFYICCLQILAPLYIKAKLLMSLAAEKCFKNNSGE